MPSVWGLGAASSNPRRPPSLGPPQVNRNLRRTSPENRPELAVCCFLQTGWDAAPWAQRWPSGCDWTFMPLTSHLAACRACRGQIRPPDSIAARLHRDEDHHLDAVADHQVLPRIRHASARAPLIRRQTAPEPPTPLISIRRRLPRDKKRTQQPGGLTATIQAVSTFARSKLRVSRLMFRPGGWSTRGCLWGGYDYEHFR